MLLKTITLCCLLFCPALLHAETLSQAEALSCLRAARSVPREVGSFRVIATKEIQRGTRSTTTLLRVDQEGREYFRTEQVDTFKRKSRAPRTSTTLKNAEGRWTLADGKAILMPQFLTEEKIREVVQALRSGKPLPAGDPKSPNALVDSMMACCLEIYRHTHVSGERFEREGKKWVRVEERIDEEGQKALRKAVKTQVDQAKKALPLAVRIMAAPFIAAMDLTEQIPMRSVHLIDETEGRIVSTDRYNAAGKQLVSAPAPQRERIADLPDSTFALPAGVEQLHPKDLGEYLDLVKKAKSGKSSKSSKELAPHSDVDEADEADQADQAGQAGQAGQADKVEKV